VDDNGYSFRPGEIDVHGDDGGVVVYNCLRPVAGECVEFLPDDAPGTWRGWWLANDTGTPDVHVSGTDGDHNRDAIPDPDA
jgi:hypothetical protein